jgi:adenosine deaminase
VYETIVQGDWLTLRFFGHFNTYLYKLISDLPSLILATRAVLQAFQDDGVAYFELRTTPRSIGSHSPEDVIRAVLNVIDEWNAHERMSVGLILSIDQAKHDSATAMRIVDMATTLQKEGKAVVGVDLCGDPHNVPDVTIFRSAFQTAKQRGLGVVLHYAEVPASSTRPVLEEMLAWNPDRLGHVIHVPLDLRRQIIERGISVELCLTCNVLAGMLPSKASFDEHHFGEWWRATDQPRLSLGTDDVGVFGSMSSEEYLLAAKHFGLSRRDLIKLSRCALSGSLGDARRAIATLDRFEQSLQSS